MKERIVLKLLILNLRNMSKKITSDSAQCAKLSLLESKGVHILLALFVTTNGAGFVEESILRVMIGDAQKYGVQSLQKQFFERIQQDQHVLFKPSASSESS